MALQMTGYTKNESLLGKYIPMCGTNIQTFKLDEEGESKCFIPLFSTIELLEKTMKDLDIELEEIAQIFNVKEFVKTIPESIMDKEICFILDFRYTEDGCTECYYLLNNQIRNN